jgi:DNA-binding transcriptional LysR family regulator
MPGSPFRLMCDRFCQLAGFAPRVGFESDDPATVRGLIRAGQGVSFVPERTWGVIDGPGIALLKLKEPTCSRTIGLSHLRGRFRPPVVLQFDAFIAEFFQTVAGDGRVHV